MRSEDPDKRREYRNRYKQRHPGIGAERSKEYRQRCQEKARKAVREGGWRRRGIVDIETARYLWENAKECMICKSQTLPLVIDHNHATGMVRGVLCHRCNRILGSLEDDHNLLHNMALYLGQNSTLTGIACKEAEG